jgi:phenylalanyl-tRNA synthetase beta subunit
VWGTATPLEADAPKWAAPLYGLEIKIAVGQPALVRYQPVPTQPPVVRDLSLVLPAGVTAAAVEDVLRRARAGGGGGRGGSLLERLEVLDEYRGPGLPEEHAASRGAARFDPRGPHGAGD